MLQKEIEDEYGLSFAGRIKDKARRKRVRLTKQLELDSSFMELWDRLKYRTTYRMHYTTAELLDAACTHIRAPDITLPRIVSTKARIVMSGGGVAATVVSSSAGETVAQSGESELSDVVYAIQLKGLLTRTSVLTLLLQSGLLEKVRLNAQQVIDQALHGLSEGRADMIAKGITYTKLPDEMYALSIFDEDELSRYLDTLYVVQSKEKTPYDYVIVDSDIERDFAAGLEARTDVRFYCKLPPKFKIDTPLGGYTPDWAIVFDGDKRVYFVAETKGANDLKELSLIERVKIACGHKHFNVLQDIVFQAPVVRAADIRV